MIRVAVLAENTKVETRVAATPDSIKRLLKSGVSVVVASGAGETSGIPDAHYVEAGATIAKNNGEAASGAHIVLAVRRPELSALAKATNGTLLLCILEPYGAEAELKQFAEAGVSAVAMELLPRITRAQSMDVLSSQANLAGYRAVVDAAAEFGRALPMMMTAAGTVPAAKVFVMGAGVAGLQAIATARRLGAVVSATDVRPAAKEQVASLGAKFIAVENDEFKAAETSGGYAKDMSDAYKAAQAELVAKHIAAQDIVITTAQIPGRPAPLLVTSAMVESMKPGSIVVDIAVDRGGNCELSKAGKVVEHKGVKIVGHLNIPGRLAASTSQLYARNLLSYLETLVDLSGSGAALKRDDEIVKATLVTDQGQLVHPLFGGQSS
jgi:H+-translocating NAD(P) transhydrogenase subunit alpha